LEPSQKSANSLVSQGIPLIPRVSLKETRLQANEPNAHPSGAEGLSMTMQVLRRPPSGCPPLVLNADYRPLSYYPLSLWPWQEVIKAVFLERVDVISTYDQVVRSPSFEMQLPSVVALKSYVAQDRPPAFTRFNLFLRDSFACQYCGSGEDLTFDHINPRSRGGRTTWENIVTACAPCNLSKGGRTPREAGMVIRRPAMRPTMYELQDHGRRFPPNHLHESWLDYLYWDIELEA
jgi:5-methylcytosine-specific restriction endonuclease McrA